MQTTEEADKPQDLIEMQKYKSFQNEPCDDNEASIFQPEHVHVQLPNNRMARSVSSKSDSTSRPTTTTNSRSETTFSPGTTFLTDPEFAGESVEIGIIDPAEDHSPTDSMSPLRIILKRFVEHFIFRLFSLILIIADISVLISDLSHTSKTRSEESIYDTVSLCFVSYFVFEVFLRMYVKGLQAFFAEWFNAVDFFVVIIGFVVTLVYVTMETLSSYAKLVIAGRLIRVVLFIRLYTEHRHIKQGARKVVSENKRRYQKDGFDLDLTYITERVIAMSFPSSGKMSFYRNPITEVARFFNTKYKDHYKIYNLCSEKGYDTSHFFGRVERFMIDDHNVPTLREMKRFVQNVKDWLDQSSENIIAVHCKGGKGRTGTMICAWLVESEMFASANAALDYFATRRTDLNVGTKFQGVETPSQSRFVGYYEAMKMVHDGNIPPVVQLQLRQLKITALVGVGKGDGSDLSCEIRAPSSDVVFLCDFGLNKNCQAEYQSEADVLQVTIINCPVLSEDVRIKFNCSTRSVPRGYEDCAFYFWFNTSFIEDERLTIPRDQIDNCHKVKTHKIYREKFSIEVTFAVPGDEQDIPLN